MTTRLKRPYVVLLGSVLLAATLLAISAAATQIVARQFGYHPALGTPVIGRLYAPWCWFTWQDTWYPGAPDTFNRVWLGVFGGTGLSLISYVLGLGFATRSSIRHEGVHGTAHWADEREVRGIGLLPADGRSGAGVYVGGWTDAQGRLRYLRHNGPEHIAAIAPTRSGKGVGLVVPTLLSWPHSVVVNDMKSELWAMTAGWRRGSAGNAVMKFDPAAEAGSVAFNALEEVRLGTPHEVGDVQNLVTILVDPDGKGLIDHWSKSAHALLTGVILHLGYTARARSDVASLPDVTRALSDPAQPINALYKEMLHNRHLDGAAHPVVVGRGARYVQHRGGGARLDPVDGHAVSCHCTAIRWWRGTRRAATSGSAT